MCMSIYMHNNYVLCIMGTVDGHGYDGQHKCTICDTCRPCHLILSALKPVFFLLNSSSYNLLRCLDLQIWHFYVHDDDITDYFTPYAWVWGNYRPLHNGSVNSRDSSRSGSLYTVVSRASAHSQVSAHVQNFKGSLLQLPYKHMEFISRVSAHAGQNHELR